MPIGKLGGGLYRRLSAIALLFLAVPTALGTQTERDEPARVHPVVTLMESRLARASVPGQRTDDLELCLAIEGGGMRGVVSAGMVTALEALGLPRVFDAVYGTSAGAIMPATYGKGPSPHELAVARIRAAYVLVVSPKTVGPLSTHEKSRDD